MSLLVCFFALVVGCKSANDPSIGQPPAAPREFRAVWVATVENIDWPTKPGLSTEDQKKEAIAILDRCQELKINAVVLQIRTACDALYDSKIEPWSFFLTGKQGQAPAPYYDPLKFWIAEAHQRGIELHAWFNPYRARPATRDYELASTHIRNRHPHAVKEYGKMLWLDPGDPVAAKQSYDVFMDVVKRYDVDGIHIDDYFYPYPVKARSGTGEEAFPDDPSWNAYASAGGKLARDDWRRKNVDDLVEKIYEGTKAKKKWVKFGISPFGLCRPGQPEGSKGFDQYEKLYADAKLWINKGWCDYWTPQLYWKIGHATVPFEPLLKYWAEQNTQQRHLWPGLFTSRLNEKDAATAPTTSPTTAPSNKYTVQEILDQTHVIRHTPGASGEVHFSMNVFLWNGKGINEALKGGPYREDALVPASPWLDAKAPSAPNLSIRKRGDGVNVALGNAWFSERAWQYGVYVKYGDTWKFQVVPASTKSIDIAGDAQLGPITAIAASAVDRCGNESVKVIRAVK